IREYSPARGIFLTAPACSYRSCGCFYQRLWRSVRRSTPRAMECPPLVRVAAERRSERRSIGRKDPGERFRPPLHRGDRDWLQQSAGHRRSGDVSSPPVKFPSLVIPAGANSVSPWKFAVFTKKQRPAIRSLNPPPPPLQRAGEGSLFVPKKLGSNQ